MIIQFAIYVNRSSTINIQQKQYGSNVDPCYTPLSRTKAHHKVAVSDTQSENSVFEETRDQIHGQSE